MKIDYLIQSEYREILKTQQNPAVNYIIAQIKSEC